MRKSLRSILVATVAAWAGFTGTAHACSTESYTGTVCTFAFDFCPRNWVEANGALLPVNN